MNIWHELTRDSDHDEGYNQMIGTVQDDESAISISANQQHNLYIPLQFWFCRNPGLALPLIALQYHDVRVTAKFNSASSIDAGTNVTISDIILLTEYVYLDSEERKRF